MQKSYFRPALLLGAALFVSHHGAEAAPDADAPKAAVLSKEVALQLALVETEAGMRLQFKLTNRSAGDVPISWPLNAPSRLVLLPASGPEQELSRGAAPTRTSTAPTVPPRGTRVWREEVALIFRSFDREESGLYRLKWRLVQEAPDGTPRVYESNEVRLRVQVTMPTRRKGVREWVSPADLLTEA